MITPEQKEFRKGKRKTFEGRFWEKVNKCGECWFWEGAINSSGYGSFRANRKTLTASRVSWMLNYGEIPEDMQVLHRCDVRKCVNPKHLFLGTNADNVADRVSKGRSGSSPKYGVQHHNSKLNNLYVRTIRQRVKYGYSHRMIAHDFGVARQTIGRIVSNQTWVGV